MRLPPGDYAIACGRGPEYTTERRSVRVAPGHPAPVVLQLSRWIDPAAAIARRVLELIGPPADTAAPAKACAIFTSGRKPSADLAVALANFGLTASEYSPAAGI